MQKRTLEVPGREKGGRLCCLSIFGAINTSAAPRTIPEPGSPTHRKSVRALTIFIAGASLWRHCGERTEIASGRFAADKGSYGMKSYMVGRVGELADGGRKVISCDGT